MRKCEGPRSALIVAETFIGLLVGDSHSYLRQDPNFAPIAAFQAPAANST